MATYLKKVSNLLKHLFVTLPFEQNEKAFIRHNRKVWLREPSKAAEEILVEVYPVASAIIAQSYLANTLADRHQCRLVGYQPHEAGFFSHIYNFRFHRIYRSFNVQSFFYIDFTQCLRTEAEREANAIIVRLKTKKDVEDLVVEGVWIGDLLYDSHLMKYRVPTIDLGDPLFLSSLKEALCYFLYWKNYLETHPVKAVIVSHCCYYQNGIVVRLCVQKKIPCYQINATHGHLMDARHDRAYLEYLYFPEVFKTLSKEEQASGLALAKERLDMRFHGVVGVDMHYSTKSAYGRIKEERVLEVSTKKKVLIAPHCFFDSPHPYGNNLFPDFYDWFSFLGELTNRTDYEWYIKTHPDALPGNLPVIQELVKKYTKFILLPPDTSHNQLIEEGISAVLTVYGTIGVEYATRGIPVINASLANPHVAYRFNVNVSDIKEYEKILMNLGSIDQPINKNDVYEYYFMRYLHTAICWLYDDYDKFIKEIGGHMQQVAPIAYNYFLREFSETKHERVTRTLARYLDSNDYYLDKKHFPLSLRSK